MACGFSEQQTNPRKTEVGMLDDVGTKPPVRQLMQRFHREQHHVEWEQTKTFGNHGCVAEGHSSNHWEQ